VTTQACPQFNTGSIATTLQAGRDFFAINYGMGGIGAEILANRFGVGPMWNCATCKFEDSSSAPGPMAIRRKWSTSRQLADLHFDPDDRSRTSVTAPNGACAMQLGRKRPRLSIRHPSNVYHSYLKDHVKIQILHAGTNINPRAPPARAAVAAHAEERRQPTIATARLISPGASYTLEHVHNGSGNLNLTVGDSIFHCHFYPHFGRACGVCGARTTSSSPARGSIRMAVRR